MSRSATCAATSALTAAPAVPPTAAGAPSVDARPNSVRTLRSSAHAMCRGGSSREGPPAAWQTLMMCHCSDYIRHALQGFQQAHAAMMQVSG